MKICVISSSPRDDSQTLRAALFIRKELSSHPGAEPYLLDLREWNTGFINQTWKEAADVPADCRELWDTIHGAGAFIVVTPEYNGMFSPKLSAVLDLFPKAAFHRKAFGIVSASTGGLGGMRAAMHLQQYILGLYAIPSPQMLLIGSVDKRISTEGACTDEFILRQTSAFLKEFLWLSGKLAGA